MFRTVYTNFIARMMSILRATTTVIAGTIIIIYNNTLLILR